jgi:predicted nucleic acid-binding protein
VDTDVVSYLLNRHSLAQSYEELLIGFTPMISFMTVAEVYRGAFRRNWGLVRLAELNDHLNKFAAVPYNRQVCVWYARICTQREEFGRPISVSDALIAACGVSVGIPLVTNNARHFQAIDGLQVLSAG